MKTLGYSPFHDGSVALIEDGKIVSFYKEERLTRLKRDSNPVCGLMEILSEHKDIDHASSCFYSGPSENKTLEKIIGKPIEQVNHHICHASLAFYNSGFDEALVFVIDRHGTISYNSSLAECESVFLASYPASFKILHKNFWIREGQDKNVHQAFALLKEEPFSSNANTHYGITMVYETATILIKQGILENGKTMGLAAYGQDKEFVNLFVNGIAIDNHFTKNFIGEGLPAECLFKDYIDKKADVTKDNYQFYADYAYQVQKQTQNEVLNLVRSWVEKTGVKKVCIGGGYGLNVVSNENLIKNLKDVEFYFEPLADDSGNSLGSAMYSYRTLTKDMTIHKVDHTFYHGKPPVLKDVGVTCSVQDISKFLTEQRTVAVFNGTAEAGPRALGNRSILFDARNPNAKDIVNHIKKREWYRPFAGMILEEYFEEYFETHGLTKSELMTISFDCKKPNIIPGVVHVDNSCRIQTISNNIPHIHKLLNNFYSFTGCPVLLNTSFNLAGQPLIQTQEEAIECFYNSNIDVLWLPELKKYIIK